MRKAVFFDLDNTLYSYDNADDAAQKAVDEFCARQFGLPAEFTERRLHEIMELLIEEMGWRQAATHDRLIRFSRFLQDIGQPVFPYAGMMYDIYWDTLIQNMTPEKGVYRFLGELKGRGYYVACATNMLSRIQYRKVRKLGMGSLLEDLITSAEVCTEKPDPEFFRFCVKKAGFKPEECGYIGDNYRLDVLGSREAGLLGILYQTPELAARHEGAGPGEAVIRDYSELEENLRLIESGYETFFVNKT
ncbi:MAG: HAD family hydrolase [Bilifractor sp.]|jgi:putative hydrolase of the HAD superfamily